MKNMNASNVEKYVEALESLVSENTSNSEKNEDEVVKMLIKALADEWLAGYQYWVCKNLAQRFRSRHVHVEIKRRDALLKRIEEQRIHDIVTE